MIFNRLAVPADFTPGGGCVAEIHHPLVSEHTLQGQAPQRDWEYSLALWALQRWGQPVAARRPPAEAQEPFHPLLADIGGAGSNFWQTLTHYTSKPIYRIDPNHEWQNPNQSCLYFRQTLGQFLAERNGTFPPEGPPALDAVFCLSVVEHVLDDEFPRFVDDLAALVRPGGLLVLTADVGETSVDHYHFHWMRQRIFTPFTLGVLGSLVCVQKFQPLGSLSLTWQGPTVYDYTFGMLALVKEG